MNLSYGSQGEEVRKLQEALNSQGYGLSVDGIYGANTRADAKKLTEQPGRSGPRSWRPSSSWPCPRLSALY